MREINDIKGKNSCSTRTQRYGQTVVQFAEFFQIYEAAKQFRK